MPIRLKDLIERIPPQTEAIVAGTLSRFNQAIREALRRETGLRLNLSRGDRQESETRSVKVYVKPGLPEELQSVSFEDDKWLAILLAPWRETLLCMSKDVSKVMKELVPELMKSEKWAPVLDRKLENLRETHDLAEKLFKEVEHFDLLKEILAVNADVLGQYSYRYPHADTLFYQDEVRNVRIDIYWGVVGLAAKILGVPVEGLSFKVLAHELAHAYTHVGADIDGKRWDTSAFTKADRALKEGLAQYYAYKVIERFDRQMPEGREAYEKLLPKQPPDYHTHEEWIERGCTPEIIRRAMIETRRNSKGTLANFMKALEDAGNVLRH